MRSLLSMLLLGLLLSASLVGSTGAAAQSSRLQVSPEVPQPGELLTVRYTPSRPLQGESRLVLRGRVHENPAGQQPRISMLAELLPDGDGRYRGVVRLPASAVYVVLGVEDAAGETLDLGNEEWDVVIHGADRRPLRHSLVAKVADLEPRNNVHAGLEARRLVTLYPDHPEGWLSLFYAEQEVAGPEDGPRLLETHRANLSTRLGAISRASSVYADDMAALIFYAQALDDTSTARVWRERLLAEHPRHASSVQQRTFMLAAQHSGNPTALLAAFEQLWTEYGTAAQQLPRHAFRLAQRIGNAEAVALWADRLEAADPSLLAYLARVTIQNPELRTSAAHRVRRQIRFLDEPRDADRPLRQSRSQQRQEYRRARGIFLGELGRSLLTQGLTEAALDTLDRAVEARWNPDLFRTIAETRLTLGDTLRATALLARVAADPATSPSFADSARLRLGRHFQARKWTAEIDAARGEMQRGVWDEAIERTPVMATVRLKDASGQARALAAAGAEPLFVAFWSRHCSPSRSQLAQLQRTLAQLGRRGIRTAAITIEEPTPEVSAFLAAGNYTFDVLYDPNEEAQTSFYNQGTPHYMIFDSRGRIRFESNGLDDIVRQASVLQARERMGGEPR